MDHTYRLTSGFSQTRLGKVLFFKNFREIQGNLGFFLENKNRGKSGIFFGMYLLFLIFLFYLCFIYVLYIMF